MLAAADKNALGVCTCQWYIQALLLMYETNVALLITTDHKNEDDGLVVSMESIYNGDVNVCTAKRPVFATELRPSTLKFFDLFNIH